MKINYSIIRTVFALAIGLVLVIAPNNSTMFINTVLGILFLIPGVIILINYFASKNKTTISSTGEEVVVSKRFPIEGVGSALLGLWLVIDPNFFADFLMRVLGIILIIAGSQQIYSLFKARKWKPVSLWFYVVPIIILGSGIYALLEPADARNTILMIIGIACLVYALTELVNWFTFMRHKPQPEATSANDVKEETDNKE